MKNVDAQLLEFPLDEMCTESSIPIILPKTGGYHQTLIHCSSIGGQLPTEEQLNDLEVNMIITHMEDKSSKFLSWIRSNSSEAKSTDYNYCHALSIDRQVTKLPCVRRLEASLCITKNQRFAFYGHEGTHFDHFFHLQTEGGAFRMSGPQQSIIRRESPNWIVESPLHETKLYLLNKTLPVGRHWWRSNESNSSGKFLSLSLCRSFEFGCNSGNCLPIEQRCDEVFQCDDLSDETNCDALKLPSTYQEFYQPPLKPGENFPSTLLYDVEVYHLGPITSDEGKAKMDVAITVSWFDSRLDFTNVKEDRKNYFNCSKIWKPSIRTVTGNGDGSVAASTVYEEQCYTSYQQQKPYRDLQDPWMGKYIYIIHDTCNRVTELFYEFQLK